MAILVERNGASIGSIDLDLTLRQGHGAEVEVSENPIETGAEIADHVVDVPDVLTIQGLQTDTPPIGGFPGRATLAWRRLKALVRRHELVDVITSTERYRNMMLLRLDMPIAEPQEKAKRFTLTLRQIQFAELDDLAALSSLVSDAGMGEADLGSQGVV